MKRATATDFGYLVRLMASEVRRGGLTMPGFRSRPAVPGASRTIRRSAGGLIVAVDLRDRSLSQVASDMAEGIIVANGLRGAEALRWRTRLLAAAGTAQAA